MARRRKTNFTPERLAKDALKGKYGALGGVAAFLLMIAALVIGYFNSDVLNHDVLPSSPSKTSSLKEGVWPVVHVADGDTLDVTDDTGTKYRIRLIGANTPETVKPNSPVEPFGPEASNFTKRVIAEYGNKARIAFDGDQTDKYGRTLALVYLETPQGELMLNEWLIREGLAHAEIKYRYSQAMKDRFQAAENAAKRDRKNIWSQ